MAGGLFLATARRVAERYPQVEFDDRIGDNMCMQLVQNSYRTGSAGSGAGAGASSA
jgi:isocitrate/isopropylmalate dehydrogenase